MGKEMSEASRKELGEVNKEVKDMKDCLSTVNKDVVEVKVMMTQVLEKLNMLEHLKKLSSPYDGMLKTTRQDILVAGANRGRNHHQNTEMYSWEKNDWFEMSLMNERHERASSFIDKDHVFVVGGCDSKTIESLDINKLPLKWKKFSGKLPYECDDHQTVVCQQSVIHIGGYNWDEHKRSNLISELQLTSPCAMKKLCQMPEPRDCHGSEAVEDKVLILGGYGFGSTTDSVLEFDPSTNKCKEMPKLPFPLSGMATVRWRDERVVKYYLLEENMCDLNLVIISERLFITRPRFLLCLHVTFSLIYDSIMYIMY